MNSKAKLLALLKERERRLIGRVGNERNALKRLDNKSRHVRQYSGIGPRIGFFTDRLQELQLVIALVEDSVTDEQFLIAQNGDALDSLMGAILGSNVRED